MFGGEGGDWLSGNEGSDILIGDEGLMPYGAIKEMTISLAVGEMTDYGGMVEMIFSVAARGMTGC